jgi:hypothetical protein
MHDVVRLEVRTPPVDICDLGPVVPRDDREVLARSTSTDFAVRRIAEISMAIDMDQTEPLGPFRESETHADEHAAIATEQERRLPTVQ